MTDVTDDIKQIRGMRVAQMRIEGFFQQFGELHLNLARHAAFPLVLTPDLLYQIWANFVPSAPWTAVARVLLSRLCRQVGYEMYEMDICDRNLLLRGLKEELGQKRFDELGEFLLDYVARRLTDDDIDTQDLRETQQWTALAYTKPDQAAQELRHRLSQWIEKENIGEVLRLASFVDTLAEPLKEAGFEPLLLDVSSIANKVRNHSDTAIHKLSEILQQENLLEGNSTILPISEPTEINSLENLLYHSSLELETPNWTLVNSIKTESMRRIVISTLGTSLLTNVLNRRSDPDEWYNILQQTANFSNEQIQRYDSDILDIINVLKERAIKKLAEVNTLNIRLASVELSVIYALYQGNLQQGKEDHHFLIASDTAICTVIANILQSFLRSQGLMVEIYQPKGFSTANSERFYDGIDDLLVWLDTILPHYKSAGYNISFNLVASSRVLQAYMDIIGMFYADDFIYILEGSNPTLINIPKIPVILDTSIIKPVQFALMEVGSINIVDTQYIPRPFLFVVDHEAILSEWGALIWKRYKNDFLSGDLLQFPYLRYEYSFLADYKKIKNLQERVKLQETLAKVSYLLSKSNADITILKQDGSLHYSKYQNTDIDHFRIGIDFRVNCKFSMGVLWLKKYGNHEYVYDKL